MLLCPDAAGVESTYPDVFSGIDVEPRAYQRRIVSQALAMFAGTYVDRQGDTEPPANSVMIESPTGSGKTIMGLAVAAQLLRRHGYSVGWVSMRRNLLAQAEAENVSRGFGIELKLISMFDKDPPPCDVLVIDEAQHDAAMSMANLHCAVRPKRILGLTATPFRTDRIKLCFDKVITDAGIQQLIQDGYLSRYHHYTLGEYTPQTVAECYLREPRKWGRSLVFFNRLDQCRECLDLLSRGSVRADVVTAVTNRERQLVDFAEGHLDVLINMCILTEGFDCPALQTVFCRPSGKSCTIQMAGRVFRRHPEFRFKQVVQCQKTPHPMPKTATAAEQYVWLEGSWRSLTLNRRIEAISNQARQLIARAPVELPKLVAAHRRRRIPWGGTAEREP